MTQRVERIAEISERRDALSQEWAALAEACGFLPLPLPNRLSTVRALLEALKPETACVSVGSNSYGHPSEETLERLARQGCTVFRTDLHGDIHLSLNREN